MHQRAIEYRRLYADSLPFLDVLSAQTARPRFSGGTYLVLERPIARAAKVALKRVCLEAFIFVESSHLITCLCVYPGPSGRSPGNFEPKKLNTYSLKIWSPSPSIISIHPCPLLTAQPDTWIDYPSPFQQSTQTRH